MIAGSVHLAGSVPLDTAFAARVAEGAPRAQIIPLRERAVDRRGQARARSDRRDAVSSHMRREIARAAGCGGGHARGGRRPCRRACRGRRARAGSTASCWSRAAPPTTSRSTRATCSRRAARSRRAWPRPRSTPRIDRRSISPARSSWACRSRARRRRSWQRWSSPRGAARSPLRSRTRPARRSRARPGTRSSPRRASEQSVAATKTFTTALAAIAELARALGASDLAAASRRSPAALGTAAALPDELVESSARSLLEAEAAVCISRGYAYATALEAALKLKEVAGLWAEGFSAADLRHGPRAAAAGAAGARLPRGRPARRRRRRTRARARGCRLARRLDRPRSPAAGRRGAVRGARPDRADRPGAARRRAPGRAARPRSRPPAGPHEGHAHALTCCGRRSRF